MSPAGSLAIGIGSDGNAGVGRGMRMANKRKIALIAGGGSLRFSSSRRSRWFSSWM